MRMYPLPNAVKEELDTLDQSHPIVSALVASGGATFAQLEQAAQTMPSSATGAWADKVVSAESMNRLRKMLDGGQELPEAVLADGSDLDDIVIALKLDDQYFTKDGWTSEVSEDFGEIIEIDQESIAYVASAFMDGAEAVILRQWVPVAYISQSVITAAADDRSDKPSKGMVTEAQRGLDWRREFGRGGTDVGIARARDIVNNKDLPIETWKRIKSYFDRHEVDKKGKGWSPGEDGYPSNGRIAWALWGGDAGYSRAKDIVKAANNASMTAAGETESELPQGGIAVAIVDELDKDAVLELLAIAPGPVVYRRHAGSWQKDAKWLQRIREVVPPPMVKLETGQVASIVSQVDEATAGQPFEEESESEDEKPMRASAGLTEEHWNKADEVAVRMALVAAKGNVVKGAKGAETLRKYWMTGKGAAKIRWGTKGDWKRCVKQLSKYLGVRSKGYCTLLHGRKLGTWPGQHGKASPAVKAKATAKQLQR